MISLVAASLFLTIMVNYQRQELELLPEPRPQKVDVSLEKITLTNSQNGVASWQLDAESADFDSRTRSGQLSRVHVRFFGDGQGDLLLTADEGQISAGGEKMKVWGHVVVIGEQGYTFYTDVLEYEQNKDLITTESPVRILSAGLEIRGNGLRLRVRDRALRILEKVEAHIEKTAENNKT